MTEPNKSPSFASAGHFPPPVSGLPSRGRARGLAAVAVAVVTAAAAIITAVVFRSSDGAGGATVVVTAYLNALAKGDAETALGLGAAAPSSTALLSDDVLKQQIQKLPITDISVEGQVTTPASNAGRVYTKASAAFGGKRSEGLIALVRSSGSWKLASAFLNARDPGHGIGATGRAFDTLQVFGKPVGDSGTISVFPGALSLSSSNPFLDVSQSAPYLLDRLQYGEQPNTFSPVLSLNNTGKQAIKSAITNWVTACYTPGATPAGPCGKLDPTLGGEYPPGTARLNGPIDFGQWSYTLDQSLRVVVSNNNTRIPFSAQRPDGTIDNRFWVGFTTPVDISKNPPVVLAP